MFIRSIAACAAGVVSFAVVQGALAETIYGITGAFHADLLVVFDSDSPGVLTTIGGVSGVRPRHGVRGIDFRPATGEMYAVSNDGVSAQLYKVDLASAALSPVGAGFTFPDDPYARLSIEFNPVDDRIRLVTGNGFNLRLNPDTGEVEGVDTPLNWAPGDMSSGDIPFAADVAFTNNVPGASSTTLFAYDFRTDVVAVQGGVDGVPPPAVGVWTTVGRSGVTVIDAGVGMDVSPTTGAVFASYTRLGVEGFARVNLATGRFTETGVFTGVEMLDIAIAVPPPACRADFDSSGAVSTADLTYFLGRFGTSPTPGTLQARADFNASGVVDSEDLVFFLGRFGQACP